MWIYSQACNLFIYDQMFKIGTSRESQGGAQPETIILINGDILSTIHKQSIGNDASPKHDLWYIMRIEMLEKVYTWTDN